MKSFTGIIFWSILLICSACTDENETNNGKRTDCYNGTPLTVRATATGFENVPGSEKPSTRASVTDEHLKTEFVDGDSIGIFSIKDGTIVDDINNIPLVYNVSNDSWNPVENSKTLYWYDGASYIAYYPYRKNITLDVSKDTDEAIASLTRNEKLQPSKDQSTKEKHTVSDLLIATGVPTTGNSSGIILNLQFKHQFTLLVLQPQAYIGCFAPDNAGFVYHKESRILGTDSAAINVNLNGITPYQIDSVKFCAIVPSQKNARITGSYVTADGRNNTNTKINYSGSSITFASGKCYTLKVISPVPGKGSTERKLYPGDFVFQNETEKRIEIHPGDGMLEENGKIYDYQNAIGMVITCDSKKMTDVKCNENGWNHAYVMGFENLGTGRWGGMERIEEGITPMTKDDEIEKNMNGYSETEQMLKNYTANVQGSYSAFESIRKYRNSNKIPDGLNRSPWFVPSIGQWFDMLVNICGKSPRDFRNETSNGLNDTGWGQETLDKLTIQLSKVGNSLPQFSDTYRLGFSCSSQYDKDRCWMLLWHIDDPEYPNWDRVCLQGYDKKAYWNVRPFFAF